MEIALVAPTALKQSATHDSPEKIRKAATDFEALMIGQMLKSVRESSFGGGWGTEDQTSSPAIDLAEQQIAQMLAANGGLGLARLIAKGLDQKKTQNQQQPEPTIAPAGSKP
jgi:peptidoglycan hydrolase FlgJ